METNGMRLLSHSRTLPNPAPTSGACQAQMWQEKALMCTLSSTSSSRFSSRRRCPSLGMPGDLHSLFWMCWAEHFQEVGWEQGLACCKWDRFALQTWTHSPSHRVIQQCVSGLHSLLLQGQLCEFPSSPILWAADQTHNIQRTRR